MNERLPKRPGASVGTAVLGIAMVALSAATWAMWMVDPGEVVLFALVAVVTAAASLLIAVAVPRDGWLAAAIVTVIPVAGPLVALWVVSLRGAAGTGADLLWDPHVAPAPIDGTELAQRLTRAVPAYEALVSGDPELRRATVGRLASRATADDVQLLRCARKRDRQLAVEVAIAFEDLDAQFVAQLRVAREAIATRPGADAHAELFTTIARAVLAKLVDPSLVARLAAEARAHHDALTGLDPDRARALRVDRARLDLAACRPELVLALPPPDDPASELAKLRTSAAYARRVFDDGRS